MLDDLGCQFRCHFIDGNEVGSGGVSRKGFDLAGLVYLKWVGLDGGESFFELAFS